jgi:hypothetical protein
LGERGKDLDVGQSEPTGWLSAGNLEALCGQHGRKLGRREGATATAPHRDPWIPARAVAEDVRENNDATGAEHPGDLGDPSRQARPVAERQSGEHQIEDAVGGGQTLSPSLDVTDRQPWSSSAKKPAGATANVQDPSCLGQEPPTKLHGCLLNGNEQELLETLSS